MDAKTRKRINSNPIIFWLKEIICTIYMKPYEINSYPKSQKFNVESLRKGNIIIKNQQELRKEFAKIEK